MEAAHSDNPPANLSLANPQIDTLNNTLALSDDCEDNNWARNNSLSTGSNVPYHFTTQGKVSEIIRF